MTPHLTFGLQIRSTHRLDSSQTCELSKKCETRHGHSYKIYVTLTNKINSKSGWSFNRDLLHSELFQLFKKYDKTHLNDHFEMTSGEMLTHSFAQIVLNSKFKNQFVKLELKETEKNRFLYENSK